MVRKISIVLSMPAKISGGGRKFQSFCGGWNKWEAHLAFTPMEGEGIASLFDTSRCSIVKEGEATVEVVVQAIVGKHYAHFSCHGHYDWQRPMESGVQLAGKEILSLARILKDVDLAASRLVVLSACETGLFDISEAPEEYLGLPAGIMPSDGCKGDTVPLAVERWYDFPIFGGCLGNVG